MLANSRGDKPTLSLEAASPLGAIWTRPRGRFSRMVAPVAPLGMGLAT